jgi:hypothetical protein
MSGSLSPKQIAGYAFAAGFRGQALTIAVAVALAESAGNPQAHNAVPPDNSYGLWQINMLGALGPDRRASLHLHANSDLFDPAQNARAAFAISQHGTNWHPWATFTNGAYASHLAAARRAAAAVTSSHGTDATPGHHHPNRIVLDLSELTRLARLFRHSADRVEHTRRELGRIADVLEPARLRLTDPALAGLIASLLTTAEAPTQLALAAARLDRQGAYAETVRRLADEADGPDNRWSAADARRFLRGLGSTVDPFERAIQETLLRGGLIVRAGHIVGAFRRHGIAYRIGPVHLPAAHVNALVNGRVPPSQLSAVGDGERMARVPASQFRRMDAAANAAGFNLHVNSGYRGLAEQAALRHAYEQGHGPLAAAPGHSTHGVGLSADVDVRNPRVLSWLRHHAGRFGFVNDVTSEPWHWTYRP